MYPDKKFEPNREEKHRYGIRYCSLIQIIKEVVNSAAATGSRNYQPMAMIALFVREPEGVTEVNSVRPAQEVNTYMEI